jgi:hypothetical protein
VVGQLLGAGAAVNVATNVSPLPPYVQYEQLGGLEGSEQGKALCD